MAIVETWQPLPGYRGYKFSNLGRVTDANGVFVPRGSDGAFHIDDGYGSVVQVFLPEPAKPEPVKAPTIPSEVSAFVASAALKAAQPSGPPVISEKKSVKRELPKEKMKLVSLMVPPSLWERVKEAAGREPVSSWVRRAIEKGVDDAD
jgi:hypothetical protein